MRGNWTNDDAYNGINIEKYFVMFCYSHSFPLSKESESFAFYMFKRFSLINAPI